MEVARAAQALAPRVAPSIYIKMNVILKSSPIKRDLRFAPSIINRKSSMRQPDYPSKFKNLKAQILTVQGINTAVDFCKTV
jgi:hypothetical protein